MEESTAGQEPEGATAGEEASKEERRSSVERQLADTEPARPGTTTPTDEQPVDPADVTDEVPESPKGVGESSTRRGEDIIDQDGKEPGRQDAGTQGQSGRPVGKSDARDSTGVDAQESADGSPTTPTGDQGG